MLYPPVRLTVAVVGLPPPLANMQQRSFGTRIQSNILSAPFLIINFRVKLCQVVDLAFAVVLLPQILQMLSNAIYIIVDRPVDTWNNLVEEVSLS